MKMKLILGFLMIFLLSMAVSADEGEAVLYDNAMFADDTAIKLDGKYADWADVEGVNITLKPARDTGSGSKDMVFKSIHDASKIYFLIMVEDDYNFYNMATGFNHKYTAALAIAFPIDEGAKAQYMGGEDEEPDDVLNTTTGEVDIMHWELDTIAGVETGGAKDGEATGNGPDNLDDEYATTPWDRHDDGGAGANNLWKGSWAHTGDGTNGSSGWWVFELSRDLASSDAHDVSFAEGETIEVAVAFWSPNETTEKKWTDDGHYVNSHGDVISMSLTDKVVGAPGFELYLSLLALFIAIPILKKRK